MRRWLAIAVLLVVMSPTVVGIMAKGAAAQSEPKIWEQFVDPGKNFVRNPDSMCKCVADTLVGPSVRVFGASKVVFTIQANSGTCSLFTAQVSNNDTTWQAAASGSHTGVLNDFSVGDSLNTGGEILTIYPVTFLSGGLPWRYARVFVTRRTGYTTTTASAGPTVACRTRADSLRWKVYIQRTAP